MDTTNQPVKGDLKTESGFDWVFDGSDWLKIMNNEPVAWIAVGDNTNVFFDLDCALSIDDNPTPLYTHPSEHDLGIAEAIGFDKGYKAATAKELTAEEIEEVINQFDLNAGHDSPFYPFARAILRKAQEK